MTAPTRIAIGAVGLGDSVSGGLDRYSRTVIDALLPEDRYRVYAGSESLRRAFPERVRRVSPTLLQRSNFAGNLGRLLWYQTMLPRHLRKDGIDLFYSPVPEGMLAPPIPQVVTVHDLLPLRYPEIYPRLRHYMGRVLPRILERSAAIITDSHSTQRDLLSFFPLGGVDTHVVHAGYDDRLFGPLPASRVEAVKQRHGLERYLLCVGEMRGYKNVRGLIEAYAETPDTGVHLAIVGSPSRLDPEIVALPDRLGIGRRVRFLGFVSDAELPALYAGAVAFVFPSLYEGFGLPPLEAMACGCPVASSSAASLPEACGDAALYFDPSCRESIAAALVQITSDDGLREGLRTRGFEQARRFTSRTMADGVARVLDAVADRRQGQHASGSSNR